MQRLAIESEERIGPATSPIRGNLAAQLAGLLGPRGSLAALTALAAIGLSLVLVSGLPSLLIRQVHARPEYAWTPSELTIDPPPPPWLPGGRDALIASATRSLGGLDGRSALDLRLDALERAFKKARWVDRVVEVRRSFPDRVAVTLAYRSRPVLVARVSGPAGSSDYLLDESGAVLSELRADDDLGPIIRLGNSDADTLVAPSQADAPDTAAASAGSIGVAASAFRSDPVVVAAATLARFLLEDFEANGPPSLSDGRSAQVEAICTQRPEVLKSLLLDEAKARGDAPEAVDVSPEALREAQSRRLFVLLRRADDKRVWILWESPPGSESPGREPDAAEKVRMLREWLAGQQASGALPDGALTFSTREAAYRLANESA